MIVDRNKDWRKTIFLAGGARSGTTWMAQIINYRNEYRYIFEPFDIKVLGPTRLGAYIRPDDRNPALLSLAEYVLSGRYRGDPRVDGLNRRFVSSQRLIKEVRANLWLKWLKEQFPSIPIVFITRHPIPSIRSRANKFFKAQDKQQVDEPVQRLADLEYYLSDDALMQDHLQPFVDVISDAKTMFEQRLVVWCVQNFVPLHQFAPSQIHLVFYEQLCMEPLEESKRVLSYLNIPVSEPQLKRSIQLPSATSRYDGALPDPLTLISSWLDKVTQDQSRRAAEILRAFGLDAIYSATNPMPNADAAHEMMAKNAGSLRA